MSRVLQAPIHLLPQMQAQAAQQPVMQIAQPLGADAIIAFVAAQVYAHRGDSEDAVKQAVDIIARSVVAVMTGQVEKRIAELQRPSLDSQ